MYKIGLSTCRKELSAQLFKDYRAAGIHVAEISVAREEYPTLDFEAIAQYAKEGGVELWSFHLPFAAYTNVASPDESVRQEAVRILSDYIAKAAAIGIKIYVIHPSVGANPDEERALRIACAKKSLAQLAQVADDHGGVLAVEDLPRTCLGRNSYELLELISADPRLRVCFDTNHLLMEDPAEFVRKVGDKIVTIHVSDYDYLNERHWLPGEGDLQWDRILEALQEVGYSGPWLYELAFESPRSMQRERELTCEDFVRNAHEIFEGKELTVLPSVRPKMYHWTYVRRK